MKSAKKSQRASNSNALKKDNRLTDLLNLVLADSYTLMGLTHQAHWNVEGSDFFALHQAFQDQYENLFQAIDEIAERIRALDSFAAGGLSKLAGMAGMKEFPARPSQRDYVEGLVSAHQKLLEDLVRSQELSGQINDLETQDLMTERVAWHQKTLWMLKSYLK